MLRHNISFVIYAAHELGIDADFSDTRAAPSSA